MMRRSTTTALILCSSLLSTVCPESGGNETAGGAAGEDGRLIVAAGDAIRLEPPSEDGVAIEAALGGGALRPVSGALAAPDEGVHWLAVASRDRAGNLSPIRWIEVAVDTRPPAVELATRPPAAADEAGRLWLPPAAEASVRADDELAGVARVALEVGGELRESGVARVAATLPDAGQVRIRAWAVDRVGNRSPDSTLAPWIDGEPPAVAVRAAAPWLPGAAGDVDGALLAPSSRLAAEVRDEGSGGVEWSSKIDGEPVSREAWQGPWEAGEHTVEVTATDRVGNRRRVGPFRFTVDGEGPEISWRVTTAGATGDDGESWYRAPVEVVAEASDRPAGVYALRAAREGEGFEPVGGPIRVEGDRLRLHAVDRVANATEVTATWKLDHDPPEVVVLTPDGETVAAGGRLVVTRGEEIELRAVDRGVGLADATYVMNRRMPPGERWPLPLPERLRCEHSGYYFLKIAASDRLGNAFSGRWIVKVRRPAGGGSEP